MIDSHFLSTEAAVRLVILFVIYTQRTSLVDRQIPTWLTDCGTNSMDNTPSWQANTYFLS
jgi:hypothetical protein